MSWCGASTISDLIRAFSSVDSGTSLSSGFTRANARVLAAMLADSIAGVLAAGGLQPPREGGTRKQGRRRVGWGVGVVGLKNERRPRTVGFAGPVIQRNTVRILNVLQKK